jgi:hypothetical protein
MKTFKTIVAAAILAVGMNAHANLITPAGTVQPGNDSAAFFNGLDGAGGIEDLVLLYKAEYNDGVFGGEEGLFSAGGPAGPQFTIVHPYNGDNTLAEISWNLTGTGYELYYVAWKGGTSFRYSGVEDDQMIIGGAHVIDMGVIPKRVGTHEPAISHISFYGRVGQSVPDAGTSVLLLGAGLLGIGALRRRLAK